MMTMTTSTTPPPLPAVMMTTTMLLMMWAGLQAQAQAPGLAGGERERPLHHQLACEPRCLQSALPLACWGGEPEQEAQVLGLGAAL